jgi:DNA-binding transcriptional MerR regulator
MSSSAAANGATERTDTDTDTETENDLTIEQLAAQAGMSVRNIRAHQARGLLAPPEVRMRVGYYGPEHVAQLQQIRELQDEGFNLNGIKRLLEDQQGTAERLLHFKRSLAAPRSEEAPQTLTPGELSRRFRVDPAEGPAVLARALKLGILTPAGDGRYEASTPSLLELGDEVVGHGISLDSALSVLEDIERHSDSVSKSFVKLFLREVWKPFAQADMPPERWPEIDAAVQRLRPIAAEAVMEIFQSRLSSQIEGAFSEITRRLSERSQ